MPPPDPKRVLIVRPSALGDVARTVPAAVAIKRRWPNCKLSWVANRPFAAAIAHHPAVDEVIPFDRDEPRKVFRLMRELRRQRFDVVYDLQGLARSGLLTWSTRAKRRVGFADAREGGWLGTNRRYEVARGGEGEPGEVWALRKMLGLLDADGVVVPDALDDVTSDLRLFVDPEQQAWAERWRTDNGLTADRFLVVAPTAQWGCKCWPVERFAEAAAGLVRNNGHGLDTTVVAVGAPHEAERLDAFRQGLQAHGVASVWPQTDVAGLMAVLAGARLLLANDSAPLHLAVGLGVPTVSVFGPTDPALVGPWGYRLGPRPAQSTQHLVVRAPKAADGATDYRQHRDDDTLISAVPAGEVLEAADFLLRLRDDPPTRSR
ncbi:MAG: glycosyltransferase family 9 protein [Planctomycetota bacterium]